MNKLTISHELAGLFKPRQSAIHQEAYRALIDDIAANKRYYLSRGTELYAPTHLYALPAQIDIPARNGCKRRTVPVEIQIRVSSPDDSNEWLASAVIADTSDHIEPNGVNIGLTLYAFDSVSALAQATRHMLPLVRLHVASWEWHSI